MRGGAAHDMLEPVHRSKAEGEAHVSCATLVAFECKTLSRARDIRIPGARRQPRKLRSDAEPEGVGTLWGAVADKVRRGTEMAVHAVALALALHELGRGFVLENPGNSYCWMLPIFIQLLATTGGVPGADPQLPVWW